MIGQFNQVYVVDWGICRVLDSGEEIQDGAAVSSQAGQSTQFGSVIGTPAYMSPEQAQGRVSDLTGQSDQYALGLILFEIISLQQAITGATLQEVLAKAAQGQKNPLQHVDHRVHIPLELRAIVFKATALSPASRYASIEEFAADLRRYRNGEAVLALPDTLWLKALRFVNRHRGATLASIAIVVLLALGVVFFLQFRHAAQVAIERRHRQRVQALLLAVSQHGHRIDNQLHDHEGLVHGLAGRVVEALLAQPTEEKGLKPQKTAKPGKPDKAQKKRKRGAEPLPTESAVPAFYLANDFLTTGRGPKDLVENPRYGKKISMQYPVFVLPKTVPLEGVRAGVETLSRMRTGFRMMFQHSNHRLYRLFVTLSNGVHVAYPGRGGFPAEYDGRQRPKYTSAANQRELHWGNVYLDLFDEPLIACSFPLWSDDNQFLGVVGVDLLLSEIAEDMLPLPKMPAAQRVLLVDPAGRIEVAWPEVVATKRRAGDIGVLHQNQTLKLQQLEYPEVIEALKQETSGGYKEIGSKVVAYYPVSSLGWYLVVVADRATLFGHRPRT